jgi:[protein-PII] uridylyltransferase
MSHSELLEKAREQARSVLDAVKAASGEKRTALTIYKEFLKTGRKEIRTAHDAGTGGLEIAARRSGLMDVLLGDLFRHFLIETGAAEKTGQPHPVTIMASGGYGRGHLNPASDIDLQFLVPGSTHKLPASVEELVQKVSMMLFDLGLEVSYPVRSVKEACKFANKDHPTKTALLDARFVSGDETLFTQFEDSFFAHCIRGHEKSYLAERSRDIRSRHQKYGRTPHLQEPNVKEGCGGLRDHHNLIWVLWVLRKSRDLKALVREGKLTEIAYAELEEAFEFLMRVRNELHYSQQGKPGDILTLRLQGVVATNLEVPGTNILRRSENFMRDYYRHTRNLFQHGTSLMQAFELEVVGDDTRRIPVFNFLARQAAVEEAFDGFYAKSGLIYPENEQIFEEDPARMMRFFLHSQRRNLRTSPEIRKLFKLNWDRIDDGFRRSRDIRDTFEEILQNRGQVAHIFRRMHRVGFLGRYIPGVRPAHRSRPARVFPPLLRRRTHPALHRDSRFAHPHGGSQEAVLQTHLPGHGGPRRSLRRPPHARHRPRRKRAPPRGRQRHPRRAGLPALGYRGDRLRLIMFLVDHHLTFWKTSTTMDIGDLQTIADFATAMKSTNWMEALHLFTYVDSNGTNDEAWNDWKASLMTQLHRRTAAYFEDRGKYRQEFTRPLADTKREVLEKVPPTWSDEVEAHFATLPDRYFRHRGVSSIVRHVELFHRFFEKVRQPVERESSSPCSVGRRGPTRDTASSKSRVGTATTSSPRWPEPSPRGTSTFSRPTSTRGATISSSTSSASAPPPSIPSHRPARSTASRSSSSRNSASAKKGPTSARSSRTVFRPPSCARSHRISTSRSGSISPTTITKAAPSSRSRRRTASASSTISSPSSAISMPKSSTPASAPRPVRRSTAFTSSIPAPRKRSPTRIASPGSKRRFRNACT